MLNLYSSEQAWRLRRGFIRRQHNLSFEVNFQEEQMAINQLLRSRVFVGNLAQTYFFFIINYSSNYNLEIQKSTYIKTQGKCQDKNEWSNLRNFRRFPCFPTPHYQLIFAQFSCSCPESSPRNSFLFSSAFVSYFLSPHPNPKVLCKNLWGAPNG